MKLNLAAILSLLIGYSVMGGNCHRHALKIAKILHYAGFSMTEAQIVGRAAKPSPLELPLSLLSNNQQAHPRKIYRPTREGVLEYVHDANFLASERYGASYQCNFPDGPPEIEAGCFERNGVANLMIHNIQNGSLSAAVQIVPLWDPIKAPSVVKLQEMGFEISEYLQFLSDWENNLPYLARQRKESAMKAMPPFAEVYADFLDPSLNPKQKELLRLVKHQWLYDFFFQHQDFYVLSLSGIVRGRSLRMFYEMDRRFQFNPTQSTKDFSHSIHGAYSSEFIPLLNEYFAEFNARHSASDWSSLSEISSP